MKDSETFDSSEGPTTEVELSAQDLLELSSSPAIEQSEHGGELQTLEQHASGVVTAIAPPVQTCNAPSSANRRASAPQVVWALCLAVAAVTVIRAQYKDSTPERQTQSFLRTAPQAVVSFEEPELASENERPPIQFTNPFDSSEVFEFPSGTNEADVRAAVADLLVKRAIERQGSN